MAGKMAGWRQELESKLDSRMNDRSTMAGGSWMVGKSWIAGRSLIGS